ncbi:MAG: DUF4097 family beta strand repeat-containing protein, partial [Chloroflexi bacterium]|nr:DUF4097 family beta strand repeat-containing protein [Chloroflexota bacterium]
NNDFSVGTSPRLVVDGFNGRISVSAGSGNVIRVQATIRGTDRVEYSATQNGDTVTVFAKQTSNLLFQSPGADIEITAPAGTTVDLETSNGSIDVQGMTVSGTVKTSNGRLTLGDVRGSWNARTSNGSITVTRFQGSLDLETSNGSITVVGELTAGGSNEMTTSNGNINITLSGTPNVHVDASTSNGDVESKLPVTATSFGDSHLIGTIGTGGTELRLRSSNGSITIQ